MIISPYTSYKLYFVLICPYFIVWSDIHSKKWNFIYPIQC